MTIDLSFRSDDGNYCTNDYCLGAKGCTHVDIPYCK